MKYKHLFICVCLFLFSTVAHADEAITTLVEGEPAPFTGTLFSTAAAARLLADMEANQELCQVHIETQLALQEAKLTYELETTKASLAACQLRETEIIELKQQQINLLSIELERANRVPKWVIFSGGVVGGVGLTIASAWALNQASE